MKLNDTIFGCLFLALAFLTIWSARTLPNVPGQNVGPAAFPSLLAALLGICALLLILRGIREDTGRRRFEAGAWTRSWPHVRSFLVVVGGLIFYVVFAETLGYFICAPVILLALFLSLGVDGMKALPLAAGATLAAHTIFYKMLLVPLPWGLLPVLW